MTDEHASVVTRRPVKLSKPQRWTIGVLGIGGMGGGSLAVFTRTVEAGPVAMMGLGALFFLIGFSGVLPTRLKIGDNEAEWLVEVGEQLAAVAELVPPESKTQLAVALERLSHLSPLAASPAIAGLAYEELVVAMLELSLEKVNAGRAPDQRFMLERGALAHDSGFDAVIKHGSRVALGVETKGYGQPVASNVIQKIVGQLQLHQTRTGANRVLLVTRTPLTHGATRLLNEASVKVDHVEVSNLENLEMLTEAVRRSLTDI